MEHGLARPAVGRGDHPPSHGLGLDGDAAEALGPERGRDNDSGKQIGRRHVPAPPREPNVVGRAERLDPPLDATAIAFVRRIDRAHEEAADALVQARQRVEKGEMPLQRGEPPRQHDDRPPRRYVPRGAEHGDARCLHPRRVEHREVHAAPG